VQAFADFFDGDSSTGFGIVNAFINCRKGFLGFTLDRGGRNGEVEFLRFNHTLLKARGEM
jgi:hypothetical protein